MNESDKPTSPTRLDDLNGNGIPDYREGWLYRLAWRHILAELKKHKHAAVPGFLVRLNDALDALGIDLVPRQPEAGK